MIPFTHPIPAEWLTAYYDDELDAERRERVEAHLRECAECRRQLEEWNAVSHVLTAEPLPHADLTAPADFWSSVQAQLPARRLAAATPSTRSLLLRWAPGIGLLLLYVALQVAVIAGSALLLVPGQLVSMPDWANWGYQLAANAGLGWLAWLLPGNWSGLGLIVTSLTVSGGLAVLYVAWLGYELRYGASATFARAIAEKGI